ncbi:hypothetical protein PR202_ga22397 [Eleusine coracana subsp. coracana]|uniref:Uncharacterized protein n=1 Tax=Eleusine coracana subsp. coracana TaxID=191504 RepID=A0AAV5D3T0_ELECO|nr:hypothetical protein PR202_ga22397 [Eleusine coracana subsp. coracana]
MVGTKACGDGNQAASNAEPIRLLNRQNDIKTAAAGKSRQQPQPNSQQPNQQQPNNSRRSPTATGAEEGRQRQRADPADGGSERADRDLDHDGDRNGSPKSKDVAAMATRWVAEGSKEARFEDSSDDLQQHAAI